MNKALLTGINAYPHSPLSSPVNDVADMQGFLLDYCGFESGGIRLLVNGQVTRQAILKGLDWLLGGLEAGDRALFQFSGHGLQISNGKTNMWPDNVEEAICPYDFEWNGMNTIRDKEFIRLFGNIPEGVSFIWVSDSCHSGDLLDTNAVHTGRVREAFKLIENLNVVLLAACSAYQKADTMVFEGRPNGAFTHFLLKELKSAGGLERPLKEVVSNVHQSLLRHRFSQVPQIEGAEGLKNKAFLASQF